MDRSVVLTAGTNTTGCPCEKPVSCPQSTGCPGGCPGGCNGGCGCGCPGGTTINNSTINVINFNLSLTPNSTGSGSGGSITINIPQLQVPHWCLSMQWQSLPVITVMRAMRGGHIRSAAFVVEHASCAGCNHTDVPTGRAHE